MARSQLKFASAWECQDWQQWNGKRTVGGDRESFREIFCESSCNYQSFELSPPSKYLTFFFFVDEKFDALTYLLKDALTDLRSELVWIRKHSDRRTHEKHEKRDHVQQATAKDDQQRRIHTSYTSMDVVAALLAGFSICTSPQQPPQRPHSH